MPRTSSKSAKTTASRKTSRAPRRRSGNWWSRIPADRKIDILGVLLALVGLLALLSLFSAQRGTLTGAVVQALDKVAGWGAFVLPAALILIGLWLLFRKMESLPQPNAIRLVGLALLYLCLLTMLHLAAGGGLALAEQGQGGGYLGGWLEQLLTGSLGNAGAWVALVAWLLIALALTLDLSIQEIAAFFRPLWQKLQTALQSKPRQVAAPSRRVSQPEEVENSDLPADFHPLAVGGRAPAAGKTAGREAQSKPEKPIQPVKGASSPGIAPAAPPSGTTWSLPPIDAILDPATPVAVQANLDHDRGRIIEETLASFGAPAHIVEIHRGPTVTQYGVEPEFIENRAGRTRVRVAKIVALADDLALALAAPRIRIQAPVPGRNYVGIEVPNSEISRVTLREVLESESFQKMRSALRFALGKDVAGKAMSYDLAAMPHLLIAGTTGSGKSVCVNAILCTLLMNNTPTDLRLVLVDPKRVELTGYNGIPHLLAPVVVEAERVVGALQWMLREMDNRYRKFSEAGVRNIVEFNQKSTSEHLAYLVVVIDELADLMLLAPEETERSITRLAQLARATGIHLILATQRPSVDVLTGLIKANFPARIAFAVASGVDSRVILDQPGAERLLGRGDMLFQAPDASAPVRLQGVYVAESETQRLVDYWRLAAAQQPVAEPAPGSPVDALPGSVPLKQTPLWDEMSAEDSGDPLYGEALDLVRKEGRASITMLQRRLRIGYTRAARLIDEMEEKGVIGTPVANTQVREVLDYGPTAPPKED